MDVPAEAYQAFQTDGTMANCEQKYNDTEHKSDDRVEVNTCNNESLVLPATNHATSLDITHSNGKGNAQQDESSGLAPVVAAHYNLAKEVGINMRKNSRIYYMRNLNNWMKSMFIEEQLRIVKDDIQRRSQSFRKLRVLDLCCGKGGDLKKWFHGPVCHVIFVDIAATSVEQCQERYKMLPRRGNLFSAEFITADCTKARIREKMSDVTTQLDLVSCQFAFHYCFESLPQAEIMLKNAAECLRAGGRFIGTIPNAAEIVRRIRENGGAFGNDVFNITPHLEEPYPLFGAKYDFKLEGVVDCPEFLVHFPTLVELAKKFGLKFIHVCPLPRAFKTMISNGKNLLNRMQGLERYPPCEGQTLTGQEYDYVHAQQNIKQGESSPVGTLSAPEWEVVSLYLLFVFEKVERTSWDAQGNPVFDFS